MALPDYAGDVAAALATAGVGTVGTGIFIGPTRAPATGLPAVAVFVLPTGAGPPVAPYLGTSTDWHEVALQILVRSAANSYAAGRTKAAACRTALHRLALGASYTLCMVRETEALYLGRNELGHHEFAINVRVGFDAA